MPLPANIENPIANESACPADDYWNLPDGTRAELIDGHLYDMAPPSWEHQRLVHEIATELELHVREHGGNCRVATSPVAVNLDADEKTWVEPDVLVICDPGKISERGVEGAPDMVVEVVSPSSMQRDYFLKAGRYERAGVREYWIVDPSTKETVVYRYGLADEKSPRLVVCPFDEPILCLVLEGLSITIADLF